MGEQGSLSLPGESLDHTILLPVRASFRMCVRYIHTRMNSTMEALPREYENCVAYCKSCSMLRLLVGTAHIH